MVRGWEIAVASRIFSWKTEMEVLERAHSCTLKRLTITLSRKNKWYNRKTLLPYVLTIETLKDTTCIGTNKSKICVVALWCSIGANYSTPGVADLGGGDTTEHDADQDGEDADQQDGDLEEEEEDLAELREEWRQFFDEWKNDLAAWKAQFTANQEGAKQNCTNWKQQMRSFFLYILTTLLRVNANAAFTKKGDKLHRILALLTKFQNSK